MQKHRQTQPPPETETIILDIENDLMNALENLAKERNMTFEELCRESNRLLLQEQKGLINPAHDPLGLSVSEHDSAAT